MAYNYLLADRDQLFLMPTSMREWLPEGHLAWFVLDVVAKVNTSAFHARHPNDGVGRAAYDPEMLLALMMYAYANNVRSSRRIESLCESDVAYRVICANLVPDHSTIARFRADHQAAIEGVFVDVLVLCAAAGLTSLGTIAIDGTKMGADASMAANRNAEAIRAEVAKILAEAGAADAEEDDRHGGARGDELPPELANPISRLARLQDALERIEEMEATADAEALAKAEADVEAKAAAAKRHDDADAHDHEPVQGQRIVGRIPNQPGSAVVPGCTDIVTMTRAELAATRAAGAAAQGNKLRGSKPKDPAAAVVRARADVIAIRNRLRARVAERQAREAAAAAVGQRVRGFRPKGFEAVVDDWSDDKAAALFPSLAQALANLEAARAAAVAAPPARTDVVANVTDPDSRIVKTPGGFVQGYNAQAAVNEHQVVIACAVTQEANDKRQLVPMLVATAQAAAAAGVTGDIGCVLADAGYWSEANALAPGPDRLIATQKSWRQRRAAREMGATTGPPPEGSSPLEAMEHRLRTPEGTAAYARRSVLVEPVFGDTKENRGFRRFMRRGLAAAQSEWSFINATHNLMKLFRYGSPGDPLIPNSG